MAPKPLAVDLTANTVMVADGEPPSVLTADKLYDVMREMEDNGLLGHARWRDTLFNAYKGGGLLGNPIGGQRKPWSGGTTAPPPPDPFTPQKLDAMVRSRLRDNVTFKVMHCYKLNGEKAVVFVIAGDKPVVLEDGLNLFPSDALVTQLRMLQGAT